MNSGGSHSRAPAHVHAHSHHSRQWGSRKHSENSTQDGPACQRPNCRYGFSGVYVSSRFAKRAESVTTECSRKRLWLTCSLLSPFVRHPAQPRGCFAHVPVLRPGRVASDWHLVHLGCRAQGGAGLVMAEATAVSPEGRITPGDLGLWKDAQIEPLLRITRFIAGQGAVAGIQLAHAGRKASTPPPWEGRFALSPQDGGWQPIYAPSPLPFDADSIVPAALDAAGIVRVTAAFGDAARRALAAGMKVIEIHAAHGYLLTSSSRPSPINARTSTEGSFENRTRFLRDTVAAVRQVWPDELPLLVRISATDWVANGWDSGGLPGASAPTEGAGSRFARLLVRRQRGYAEIPVGPGYQVPFARRIRQRRAA